LKDLWRSYQARGIFLCSVFWLTCELSGLRHPGAWLLIGRWARFVAPRVLHHVPDIAARLPPRPKQLLTDLIALTIYWPLARLASLAEPATAASTPSALTPQVASAPLWSSASAVPRFARCAPPPGWWICAFRRGSLISVWWGSCRGRERGAGVQPHRPVLLYYKLSGEGSAWVGFWSSTFRAGSP